eukprot:s3629_g3.t1
MESSTGTFVAGNAVKNLGSSQQLVGDTLAPSETRESLNSDSTGNYESGWRYEEMCNRRKERKEHQEESHGEKPSNSDPKGSELEHQPDGPDPKDTHQPDRPDPKDTHQPDRPDPKDTHQPDRPDPKDTPAPELMTPQDTAAPEDLPRSEAAAPSKEGSGLVQPEAAKASDGANESAGDRVPPEKNNAVETEPTPTEISSNKVGEGSDDDSDVPMGYSPSREKMRQLLQQGRSIQEVELQDEAGEFLVLKDPDLDGDGPEPVMSPEAAQEAAKAAAAEASAQNAGGKNKPLERGRSQDRGDDVVLPVHQGRCNSEQLHHSLEEPFPIIAVCLILSLDSDILLIGVGSRNIKAGPKAESKPEKSDGKRAKKTEKHEKKPSRKVAKEEEEEEENDNHEEQDEPTTKRKRKAEAVELKSARSKKTKK